MTNGYTERINAILRECAIHSERLESARTKCGAFFPLDATSYPELTADQIEHIDQLVYRFTKLQDALGAKLFPGIASALREDAEALSVMDTLALLEKVGAISDAGKWIQLRETRNELAHDYVDDPEQGSAQLNALYEAVAELEAVRVQADSFARSRVLESRL